MDKLTAEVEGLAKEKGFSLAKESVDDVLTYALFAQIGLKFLENRGNPDAFEPAPVAASSSSTGSSDDTFTVNLNGQNYVAQVSGDGQVSVSVNGRTYNTSVAEGSDVPVPAAAAPAASSSGEPVSAPLAGNIFKVCVQPGQSVSEGDTLVILEAMKMETEVKASRSGTVGTVSVKEGDSVAVGDTLITL